MNLLITWKICCQGNKTLNLNHYPSTFYSIFFILPSLFASYLRNSRPLNKEGMCILKLKS